MAAEGVAAEREDAPVVLIVEDEQDLAELYATGLGESYAVRTAFDGEQAFEELDDAVDVVLLDRRMPRLSGDEVLDRIREEGFDCRVVMVSAVEPDFDVLEMGFDDYVSKPVSAGELRETVERMLELATHDSALQEYHALVSKKIALEAKKSLRELAESDEYVELKADIEKRREELDADHAELQEAMASAAVFRDLDTSPPESPVPPTDGPSGDDRSDPPDVGASPDPDDGAVAGADAAVEPDEGPGPGDDAGPTGEPVDETAQGGDEDADAGRDDEDGDAEDADGVADDPDVDVTFPSDDGNAHDGAAGGPDSGVGPSPADGAAASPAGPVASVDALLSALPVPVLVEDADRVVVDCNPAFAARFGYEPGELTGEPTSTLYDDADQYESAGARLDALADDDAVGETVDLRTGDGATVAADVDVGVRRDDDGAVVAYVWAVRERADRPVGDRSPETTAEELAVLNRLLRHDIGNDMAIVSGWLELLREEVAADQRERLDRAIAATEHTVELTHAVGDLVRAIDEPDALDLATVSLDDVVRREVEKARETYGDATIAVDDMPPVDVRANDLVSSVVGNLLHNAVQHNDADEPRVDVSVEVGFHTATLRVADDGPGIPEERREALLEREQAGEDGAGPGIGLSLVTRLVDAYEGSVRIEDNEPRGTVVAVELSKAE